VPKALGKGAVSDSETVYVVDADVSIYTYLNMDYQCITQSNLISEKPKQSKD
jgi:hypothetical protein